ncbi:MAG: hypothetical protein CMM07_07310, partial [Rhodopirellula sp.]|nr:hypothetical protein [Rhodopirellula sp.]
MPVVTKKGASTLISSAMRKSIAAASVVSSSDSDEDEKNEGIVPDLLLASVDTPIARVIEECQSIMKLGKASDDILKSVDDFSSALHIASISASETIMSPHLSELHEVSVTFTETEIDEMAESLYVNHNRGTYSERISALSHHIATLEMQIARFKEKSETLQAKMTEQGDETEFDADEFSGMSHPGQVTKNIDISSVFNESLETEIRKCIEKQLRELLMSELPVYFEKVVAPQLQHYVDEEYESAKLTPSHVVDDKVSVPESTILFNNVMVSLRDSTEEIMKTSLNQEIQTASLKVAMDALNSPVTHGVDGSVLSEDERRAVTIENAEKVKKLKSLVTTFDTIINDQKRDMYKDMQRVYPGMSTWNENLSSSGKNSLSMFQFDFPTGIGSADFDTEKSKTLLKQTLQLCQAYPNDLYTLIPFVQHLLDNEDPMKPVSLPKLAELKPKYGDVLGEIIASQVGTLMEVFERRNAKILSEHSALPLETGGDGEPLRNSKIEDKNALSVLGYFLHWNEQNVASRRRVVQSCVQHASSYFVEGDIIDACERYSKHVKELTDLCGRIDYHSSIHECALNLRSR